MASDGVSLEQQSLMQVQRPTSLNFERLPVHRTPVSILPVEILNRIFRFSAAIDPPVEAPGHVHSRPGWYVVCWVCSHWRRVAIMDAGLWAKTYSQNHRLAPLALRRAGNMSLEYALTAHIPRVPLQLNMHSGTYQGDANKFTQHTPLERCRSIVVKDGRGDVIHHICRLASLASAERLPVLERLLLHMLSWEWFGEAAK